MERYTLPSCDEKIEALRLEVARYRAALEAIADGGDVWHRYLTRGNMQRVAKVSLRSKCHECGGAIPYGR